MILGGYQTGERGWKALIYKGLGRGCWMFGKSVAMISQTVPLWGMCHGSLTAPLTCLVNSARRFVFLPRFPAVCRSVGTICISYIRFGVNALNLNFYCVVNWGMLEYLIGWVLVIKLIYLYLLRGNVACQSTFPLTNKEFNNLITY